MVKQRKCEECVSLVEKQATLRSPYHFVESGLPNVYLVGIRYWVCKDCGMQSAEIPALKDLMVKIARLVVEQEAPLSGEEIRFLRKRLGKKSAEFGKIIGVTAEQMSRWENNNSARSESADKLIRVFYCLLSGDRALHEKVMKHVDAWLATLPGQETAYNFQAKLHDHEWAAEPVPA